jgi:16S rRNA (guanine527-N7)-methyltransferase
MTLIDSVRKKVDFQRHIFRMLDLRGMEAVHGRVQDKKILQSLGGRFDMVISRAFSDLQKFLILSFPFLKKGGIALAMKGGAGSEETQLLSKIEETGYRFEKIISFSLPCSSLKRSILLFEKQ